MSEHTLQVACVKWFRYKYPKLKMNLFAIPNGGSRGKWEGGRFKAEGVVAGVADLFLAVPKNGIYGTRHGLFVELKLRPNKLTENQLEFLYAVTKQGYQWEIVYTFDEFEEIINNWIK